MFYIDINLVFTDYIIYKYCIGIIWLIQTLITSKKNIGSILEQTIKYNQHVSITTESGNAVIISEDDYNNIMATLEMLNNPVMKEKIIDGLNTPLSECINENDVK